MQLVRAAYCLAGVAQLVEQLIRNQQVVRSIRIAGSNFPDKPVLIVPAGVTAI
jgi:hypothetical protein